MNNPHSINNAYSDFFIAWARQNLTATKKAFLVTTTFEHESIRRRRRETEGLSSGSYEKKAFQHLYNITARKLVGRNYNRSSQQHRLPSVAAFLDSEGTKFWRSAGEVRNVHLHSIWVIEGVDVEAVHDAISMTGSNGNFLRDVGFDAIDIRPIGNSGDDLSNVVRYASKALGFNSRDLSLGMDFEIYPLGAR